MSTFSGKIQEILNISVDRFDGENINSEAYFLSHCHSDHMVGLRDFKFQDELVNNNKYLYASNISCAILKKMYPYITNNLIELDLNNPATILLKDNSFSVTLIPAGHCPGSVMFLFENGMRILYTGDYRISKNDIKKFKSFYESSNEVKCIDKMYLDTTFFLKKYFHFPKREESLQELIRIIEDWTNQGDCFYINLITSAKYGYEYVFKEIFKKLNMPIHVSQDSFQFYSLIPEMDQAVTLNGFSTRIHSSCLKFKYICIVDENAKVKHIKVSALRWTQEDLTVGLSEFESGIHYVCYSTHASYEEGSALIRFLKPREIEICVKHDDPHVNKEMVDLIGEHLEQIELSSVNEDVSDYHKDSVHHKVFDTKCHQKKRKSKKNKDSTSSILRSPPRPMYKIAKNDKTPARSLSNEISTSLEFDSCKEKKLYLEKLSSNEIKEICSTSSEFLFDISSQNEKISQEFDLSSQNQTDIEVQEADNHSIEKQEIIKEIRQEVYMSKNILSNRENYKANPDSILYDIIDSKPQMNIESTVRDNDEEASRVLLDIINS